MSHPCKVFSYAHSWLCCALVIILPAVALAAPSPEGLAFLGVSILEQPDAKLSELIGRRLARMGEELLPRVRAKYCKESACFNELAQTAGLRQARFLLSAEVYQSDARQQSITVRLFDTEHNKLEEAVDPCEQCDDDRRGELILLKYSQLRQKLSNPSPPTEQAPSPVDACPNMDGVQASIPDGMMADSAGNCVLQPHDLCPNISGTQERIPKGMIHDKLGNCMSQEATDLCVNLEGIQAKVPEGMVKDAQGSCVVKQQSGEAASRRQKLRIASAIAGGIAVGLLIAGVTDAIAARNGGIDCMAIQNSMANCSPSYLRPAIELSAAGTFGIISVGLAIPLGQRK